MIPPPFDYHAPRTLPEAIALLGQLGEEAKILSGGQSLLPLLKLRFASPGHLVDIGRIPGLDYVKEEGGFLRIGALVREAALESNPLITSRYPILTDTARVIADPIVRNLATVCGNLAHGDPANDHPATMLALGASVVLTGPSGTREVPVASFFTGIFTTALQPNEVLTEIRIPVPPAGSGGAYLKLERKVGDYATVGVAVHLSFDNGTVGRAGIALTGVGHRNLRAEAAEAAIVGAELNDDTIKAAAELAAEAAQPRSDERGSADYKRSVVRVFVERGLRKAAETAQAA